MIREQPPLQPAPGDDAIAELLRLASCAGFSPSDQQSLREAISVWLPRYLRRSEMPPSESAAVELALLKLVADYARRVRSELTRA